MSEIRKGARVRVTYEGVVTCEPWERPVETCEQVEPDGCPGIYAFAPVGSLEVLPPAPRELEDGAHYLHDLGTVYRYDKSSDTFEFPGSRARIRIEDRTRLVKMVPEVTS